jgi:hypothetical protein
MTRAAQPSGGAGTRVWLATGAGALGILAGLAWGSLAQWSAMSCALGGAGSNVYAYSLAALPPLALVAFGIALWRRSPIAILLAPVPFVLFALLWIAALVAEDAFWPAVCTISLVGIGPFAHWAVPSWEYSTLGPLLFAVLTPVLGVLLLSHAAAESAQQGWKLAAAARARTKNFVSRKRWPILGLMALVGVSTFAILLVRPIPAEGSWGLITPLDAPTSSERDWRDRLSIFRVRMSLLPGTAPPSLLGPQLEKRIGPVQWSASPIGADIRYRVVTATGRLPPSVYGRAYEKRLGVYNACMEENRGVRGDERFIQEWSDINRDALTPAEISWAASIFRRNGFAILRRYEDGPMLWCGQAERLEDFETRLPIWERNTRDLLEPSEWGKLRVLLRRMGYRVFFRTCMKLWYNHEAEHDCQRLQPDSEEDFPKIALQWRCAGIRCEWASFGDETWRRTSTSPCRGTGPSPCQETLLDFLETGRMRVGR